MSEGEAGEPLPPILQGYPPVVTGAYARFCEERSGERLEVFVLEALGFLLERGEAVAPMGELPPETRLREDLEADSLVVAELVFLLEDLFAMELGNEELERVQTLRDLQGLVREKSAVE